jgi:hypothetical protein
VIKPKKTLPEGYPLWAKYGVNQTIVQNFEKNYVVQEQYKNEKKSSFCNVNGSQIAIIFFIGVHGDLPSLQINNQKLQDFYHLNGEYYSGKINIFQDGASVNNLKSVRGTTETDVCNNRGLCDKTSGICKCFDTWTSSDGTILNKKGFVLFIYFLFKIIQ